MKIELELDNGKVAFRVHKDDVLLFATVEDFASIQKAVAELNAAEEAAEEAAQKPVPPVHDEDDHTPFKHDIGGKLVWCCPVIFAKPYQPMMFLHPANSSHLGYVDMARSYRGFIGLANADENGWPEMIFPSSKDVSFALRSHFSEIRFVCFEID